MKLLNDVCSQIEKGFISSVQRSKDDCYALHEPTLDEDDATAVAKVVSSGWVSSAGPEIPKFEQSLCELTGHRAAVCVSSGTAALHMALTGKQVAVDDEVLVPSLTFVATANAITYANAIPHFVDSEFSNYGVDPYALDQHLNRIATRKSDGSVINRESGRKIVGLIVVHIFGLPAQTVLLREVLERWGLWLIEDCAEALGSYHFERHVGHDGTISTLSFNGNKIITTGGGGAVLSNDVEMIAKLRHMATTAKVSDSVRFRHDMVGYNYRLPNLNAALGLSQLSKFQRLLGLKRQLATNFALSFKDSEWVEFVSEPKNTKSNYWLCSLRLRGPASQLNVDDIIELLNRRGIQARPCWDLMSTLPMYQDMPKATLTTAQKIRASTICLPSSPKLVLTMDLSQ